MTKFEGGPAAGTILNLRRAPMFLRVVVDSAGKVDALDQLDDRPNLTEAVHVYVRMIHLNMRNAKGRPCGGYFAMAEYRLYEQQPDDATARSRAGWPKWAEEQAAKRQRVPVRKDYE